MPKIGGVVGLEHIHRYVLASGYTHGMEVLDIACGEGYGCKILASSSKKVYGVDLSGESVIHARSLYNDPRIDFLVGDCRKIPLNEDTVDVVVSFETLEHHFHHDEMMSEIRRVLRPGGLLIISTPDRDYFEEINAAPNPFHLKELSKSEFRHLLADYFSEVAILGQKVVYGSLIGGQGGGGLEAYDALNPVALEPAGHLASPYLLAFATNGKLPLLKCSLLESEIAENDVVRKLLEENNKLRKMVEKRFRNPIRRLFGSLL